jgi:heptosyltransferase II
MIQVVQQGWQPQRLLVRGVNWLGDAVMSTPALLRLREQLPQTRISMLVPAKIEPLFVGHPSIDNVIPIQPGANLLATARKVRAEKFEAVLIFPNSPRTAIEAFLSSIPVRIGHARPWRGWLLTRNIPERAEQCHTHKLSVREIRRRLASGACKTAGQVNGAGTHQVNDYLHLVAEAFGCSRTPVPPRLFMPESEVEQALARIRVSPDETIVGLNPGAEYGTAKRWPIERFIEAAVRVRHNAKVRFLIFGLGRDARICSQLAAVLNADIPGNAVNLAGGTSLRELMALLKGCRTLLTNDTGPMHVAAALGTPVVVPFGSTSPALTGPMPADAHTVLQSAWPCSPCFRRTCPVDFRCMLGINAAMAADAVLEHLSKSPSRGMARR